MFQLHRKITSITNIYILTILPWIRVGSYRDSIKKLCYKIKTYINQFKCVFMQN